MTDGVYERHADAVHGTGYIPRNAQGEYIERMKEHAATVIPNDEASNMRCASFRAVDLVCTYITRTYGVKKHRVYPALRYLGYNQCYHKKKVDGGDVFSDIARMVGISESTLDYDVMGRSATQRTFIHAVTDRRLYRVPDSIKTRMMEESENAGLRTSDMNLYYVMTGVKVLVENESDFYLLRENEIIGDVLRVLSRTDRSLEAYRNELERLR